MVYSVLLVPRTLLDGVTQSFFQTSAGSSILHKSLLVRLQGREAVLYPLPVFVSWRLREHR